MGARAVGDAHATIADPAVDALLVASHDPAHAQLTVAAVRTGKPVVCEKPLAPTPAESVDVLQQVGTEGAELLSLASFGASTPATTPWALRWTTARWAPRCSSTASAAASPPIPGTTSEMSVSASAVHQFDIVPWLLRSEVVEVAWAAPRQPGLVTGMQHPRPITLRTADHVLTTVELCLNARYGYDMRCEVVRETGTVSLAEPARMVFDSNRARSSAYWADWRPWFADAYRLELQARVDRIHTGRLSELATGRDGLLASAAAAAVLASMHGGGRTVGVEVLAPAALR